jgi:hypothetical protein
VIEIAHAGAGSEVMASLEILITGGKRQSEISVQWLSYMRYSCGIISVAKTWEHMLA